MRRLPVAAQKFKRRGDREDRFAAPAHRLVNLARVRGVNSITFRSPELDDDLAAVGTSRVSHFDLLPRQSSRKP
jgi:hypothetical protein